ncbi:hypothetical protein PanWU01x14_190110, partial [Parasponia andersonii]
KIFLFLYLKKIIIKKLPNSTTVISISITLSSTFLVSSLSYQLCERILIFSFSSYTKHTVDCSHLPNQENPQSYGILKVTSLVQKGEVKITTNFLSEIKKKKRSLPTSKKPALIF